jgi:hypothetical protein
MGMISSKPSYCADAYPVSTSFDKEGLCGVLGIEQTALECCLPTVQGLCKAASTAGRCPSLDAVVGLHDDMHTGYMGITSQICLCWWDVPIYR